jgi:hypothetical protein
MDERKEPDPPQPLPGAIPFLAAAALGGSFFPYKNRKVCVLCEGPIGPGDGYRNTKVGTVHTSCAAGKDANGRAQENPR